MTRAMLVTRTINANKNNGKAERILDTQYKIIEIRFLFDILTLIFVISHFDVLFKSIFDFRMNKKKRGKTASDKYAANS